MENLKSENISTNPNAKTIVVFGGDIHRRDEITNLLLPIEKLTIYGTLSEEEGLAKIEDLSKVEFILIGGRYTISQRNNIKQIVSQKHPNAQITEPGVGYQYSNENIFNQIKNVVNNETAS